MLERFIIATMHAKGLLMLERLLDYCPRPQPFNYGASSRTMHWGAVIDPANYTQLLLIGQLIWEHHYIEDQMFVDCNKKIKNPVGCLDKI